MLVRNPVWGVGVLSRCGDSTVRTGQTEFLVTYLLVAHANGSGGMALASIGSRGFHPYCVNGSSWMSDRLHRLVIHGFGQPWTLKGDKQ